MKINFIQISNILSFKYCENIDQAEKIEFKKDLNILIGQNGSGKSTALEVVNFIFKRIVFVPYTLNESIYAQKDISQNEKNRVISKTLENTIRSFRLEPNWDTESNEQKIRIEIELDEIDSENIDILTTYKEELKSFASKFSTENIPDILNLEKSLSLK